MGILHDGFLRGLPVQEASTGDIVATAIAIFLVILIILGMIAKKILSYNLGALKSVLSFNANERTHFHSMKDETERAYYVHEVQQAQALVHGSSTARAALLVIPSRDDREQFLKMNSVQRAAHAKELNKKLSASRRLRDADDELDMMHARIGAQMQMGMGTGNMPQGVGSAAGMNRVSNAVGEEHAPEVGGDPSIATGAGQQGQQAPSEMGNSEGIATGAGQQGQQAPSEMGNSEGMAEGVGSQGQQAPSEMGNAESAAGGGGGGGEAPDVAAEAPEAPDIPDVDMPNMGGMDIEMRDVLPSIIEQVKIVYSLVQVSSVWKTNFDIQWPEALTDLTRRLAVFNFTLLDIHSVACVATANYIDKFLFMTVTPLLLVGMLVTLHMLTKKLGIAKGSIGSVSFVSKIIFTMLFCLYPSICNTTLRMFSCRTLADESSWLKAQYSISCARDFPISSWMFGDTMTMGFYRDFALVMTIIYPICVPLLFFFSLSRNREKLYEPLDPLEPIVRDSDGDIVRRPHAVTKQYLGMLYISYSSKYYWWESVELVRKLSLTGIIIFIAPDTAMQLAAGCLMALTATLLYSEFKPYLYGEDDMLQLLCQLSIFCTMFAGLLIKSKENGKSVSGQADSGIFEGLLVFLNIAPVVVGLARVVLLIHSVVKHFGKYVSIMKELHQQGELQKICKLEKIVPEDKKKKAEEKKRKKKGCCGKKKTEDSGMPGPLKAGDMESQLEEIMGGDLEAGGANGKASAASAPTLVRVQGGVGREDRSHQAADSAAITQFKGAAPEATV